MLLFNLGLHSFIHFPDSILLRSTCAPNRNILSASGGIVKTNILLLLGRVLIILLCIKQVPLTLEFQGIDTRILTIYSSL